MIPILYEGNEQSFINNGLGRLSDAISCKVVEERNATYELEMTYPITGAHYNDIQESRIILAQPHEGGLTEPFVIYKISRPLNGVVTINAQHISYMLSTMAIMPFSAGSIQEVFSSIPAYTTSTCPFNFTTDVISTTPYSIETPRSVRNMLGGESGSILDVYGRGDYEFSRWNVILRQRRGADNGVTLRYGKNITALNNILDMTQVYTGVCPFWTDGETTVVLPEKVILSTHVSDYPYQIIKTLDLSGEFEEAPTVAQLRDKAQQYVTANEGWKIKNNITVSFVQLWNTEEYKHIAALERVQMGDTVHIVVPKLAVDFSTRVVKTDYDVLLERYNSITLGDTYYTLNTYFDDEINTAEAEQTSHMQKAIARATKLIQGGLGGHVVFNVNADGEPQEILIMDTDNIQTAVNVIRMNLGGIGFSTSGYNGPFRTAWTIDGHFVADFIDTGTLNADVIKAGVLQDENANTTFNLATGALKSKNLTIDSTYFKLDNTGKITSITNDGKKLVMEKGTITGYKSNGDLSAKLEIGDGYFNIANGVFAIQGVVGVSGRTDFVKSLQSEEYVLGTQETKVIQQPTGVTLTGGSVSLSGCSTQQTTVTIQGYVTVDGRSTYLSGNINMPSISLQGTPGFTAPTGSLTQGTTVVNQFNPSYMEDMQVKAVKSVAATTGSINSQYGIIQSIS